MIIESLYYYPVIYIVCFGILGLLIGSFLNVVIYRLPIMIYREWKFQCQTFLQQDHALDLKEKAINLAIPRSFCPHCQHKITAIENIPLLSFIFLRGRCRHCQHRIPWRYPAVELLSCIFAIFVAYHFTVSWQTLGALILSFDLIVIAIIDLQEQLIPDCLSLPLLWLGVIFALFHIFVDLESAVIGAIAGYLSLWIVNQVFKWISKREGMGYGDFKLLAMLGAWLGWQMLPLIILLAAGTGSLVGIGLMVFKAHDRKIPIAFGPYLAIAGWIALLWGGGIMNWYLSSFNL